MAAAKRYFAVGLRGWVQIRVATKPPLAVTSESTTIVKEKHLEWDSHLQQGWGGYHTSWVERPLLLKQTVFNGGRVIATIKASKFSSRLKIGLREGGLLELMPEQIELLKGKEEWI